MATVTKKQAKDKAKAVAQPVPQVSGKASSELDDVLASAGIGSGPAKPKKKGSVPLVERPDLAKEIETYLEGAYIAKDGESRKGLHEGKLKDEGEKERMKLCSNGFQKSVDFGDLLFIMGNFSPTQKSENMGVATIQAAWDKAFGEEGAKKYISWQKELRVTVSGVAKEDQGGFVKALVSMSKVKSVLSKIAQVDNATIKEADELQQTLDIALKYDLSKLFTYDSVVILNKSGEDTVLAVDYSTDPKVKAAVDELIKGGFLSYTKGALRCDQEALVKVGERRLAREKALEAK